MKKLLLTFLISAFLIAFVPPATIAALSKETNNSQSSYNVTDDGTICVFLSEKESAVNMSFREYIIGVVAAEMPVEFHGEALSAGACAAATLARLKMLSGGDDALQGAVISTDPKKHQAYMGTEQMKERWGEDFDAYYKKLTDAVDKAIDYSITYEGELITPAYHAMSTGLTEDAGNVWSESVPYLVSVESPGDPLAPKYETKVSLSFEEFTELMEENGAALEDDIMQWLSAGVYTEAGTLTKIVIGGKAFSGEEIRDIFSLRSAAVTFSMTKDGVVLTVRGYGHGVGLSQYGADYLADEGYTWQEILKHYYTGVKIELM